MNADIIDIETKIRNEMRKLFHRHDVVSLSLKGEYPDYFIDVGVNKKDILFPKFIKIEVLGKEVPIKTKTIGRIVPYHPNIKE